MSVEAPQDGTQLEIQRCGAFLEDDKFKTIRATVNRRNEEVTWPPKEDMNPHHEFIKVSTQMDSVYFLNDRFELVLDVRGFSPEDIQCVLTTDAVEVTAMKDQMQCAQGFSSENTQNATRRYRLPQKINPYESACYLSSDGVLAVTAAWAK